MLVTVIALDVRQTLDVGEPTARACLAILQYTFTSLQIIEIRLLIKYTYFSVVTLQYYRILRIELCVGGGYGTGHGTQDSQKYEREAHDDC